MVGPGETQKVISIIFLLVALACAPIMLCVKPMILKRTLDRHHHEEGAGHGVEVKSEKLEYKTVGGKNSQPLLQTGNEHID